MSNKKYKVQIYDKFFPFAFSFETDKLKKYINEKLKKQIEVVTGYSVCDMDIKKYTKKEQLKNCNTIKYTGTFFNHSCSFYFEIEKEVK